MNIHESTRSYLLSVMQTRHLEQAAQVIKYRFKNPSKHWLLPLYSCQSVNGDQKQAIPAMAALIAFQTAILLVDDLLDNDGRRETLDLSVGESANLSMALQAAGIECITSQLPSPDQQIKIVNQINRMIMETAYGQSLDNQKPENEEAYWQATRAKSCPFFGLAFYLGAVAGGASAPITEAMLNMGYLYGEMIQIHDDLNDSLSISVSTDWIQQKTTLPILFAQVVNHSERQKFMALSENPANQDGIREAQAILLRCGAVSFCVDQLVQRYKLGKELIDNSKLPNSRPINQLFDEIIAPIWNIIHLAETQFVNPPLTSSV